MVVSSLPRGTQRSEGHRLVSLPPVDPIMEAFAEGYSLAASHAKEGRRIGRETDFWGRVGFALIVFASFAAVALTATWIWR